MRQLYSKRPQRSTKAIRSIKNILNRYVVDRSTYKTVDPVTKTKIYIEEKITATYVQTVRVMCKRRIASRRLTANRLARARSGKKRLLSKREEPEAPSMDSMEETVSQDHHSCEKPNCRVLVYDKQTNAFLIGGTAPTPDTIQQWLLDHPTYEIVRYGTDLAAKFDEMRKTLSVDLKLTDCCGQAI